MIRCLRFTHFLFCLLLINFSSYAAIGNADSLAQLKQQYLNIQQANLDKPTIYPNDIYPLIEKLKQNKRFTVVKAGTSYLGKPIYHITVGNGPRKVFMWSQMHGDEPTATGSLFDFINYIDAPENQAWFNRWKEQLTIHMVPMVNPDGAKLRQRFNAQGIDINRDAKRLQTPEGRMLNQLADQIKPEFGFNLHDQGRFYSVGTTENPATISVLAPAFNDAKDISGSRKSAMQLIGLINESIQQLYPNHVGRYDDTYSYRAFGDLFSSKGIATTLIESGGHHDDPHRQVARWLTFMSLVQSIDIIKDKRYENESLAKHDAIPMNKSRGLVDLLLKNVTVNNDYLIDMSIYLGRDFNQGKVSEIGDISHGVAYMTVDMSDYQLLAPKAYTVTKPLTLTDTTYKQLLQKGYNYFVDKQSLLTIETDLPVITKKRQSMPEVPQRGQAASFIFTQEGKPKLAIIGKANIALD
ncbi:M14 metallopeptidase family protein [Thalassotalea sp. G2M2-11]|uniref:M14 family metallopeptidase n=1 Tax=Thalassotalea sp. G2M2-11 TaxID=2787627 RepID=UPI0019D1ADFA|nr:M14 metallopeptidase family protein [Thalassotalea sp. G2M2-11]